MSEVTAALTPEEWREYAPLDRSLAQYAPAVVQQNAHGAAALALHGQPYGFTWDDYAAGAEATGASTPVDCPQDRRPPAPARRSVIENRTAGYRCWLKLVTSGALKRGAFST